MKKAILFWVAIILLWGGVALYFLGSPTLAEVTKLPVQVYDCLSVLIGFAGVACMVLYNEKKTA